MKYLLNAAGGKTDDWNVVDGNGRDNSLVVDRAGGKIGFVFDNDCCCCGGGCSSSFFMLLSIDDLSFERCCWW